MSHNHSFSNSSIFIGIDFGISHIGVASGQRITATATPIKTIFAKRGIPDWQQLDKIIQEWNPSALVVGVPVKMDGSEQWTTKAARKFIITLKDRYKLPVYEVDETLTTKEAREKVFAAGGFKAIKKVEIDSIAAKLLLESWMAESISSLR